MNASRTAATSTSLAAITICAVLQVLAQVVFQVVIAKQFGASKEVDSFSAALAVPTVLSAILTSFIGYIMVPLLVPLIQDVNETTREKNEQEFRQVALSVGIWAIGTCLIATLSVAFCASPLTTLLYPRFGSEEHSLVSNMLRILSPLIVLSAVQGWLQGIYHSRQNFIVPALASAVGPSAITLLLFIPIRFEQPIYWIAWCLFLGTLATLSCLVPAIRFAIPQRLSFPPSTMLALRRSIPLIAFNSYTKLDPVIDRVLLAGLTVGAISHLNYAQRFITALVLVASSGVSTMAFSDLAGAYSGDLSQFRVRFYENLRRMLLVVIPVVVGLSLFAQASIRTLLERGEFTSQDTTQVSILLIALIGFFVASAVGDLIAKCFYALGDTKTPSIIGALAFTLGMGFKIAGVQYWGVLGLAIATSGYTLLSVLIMLPILYQRLQLRKMGHELGPTIVRSILGSTSGSLVAAGALWLPITAAWWIAVMLGVFTYTAIMLALRDPTWRSMILRKTQY